MNEVIPLFDINPKVDRTALAARFAKEGRIQIRDILTNQTARTIQQILLRQTKWGLAWRSGEDGPHAVRQAELPDRATAIYKAVGDAAHAGSYTFAYAQYPLVEAYLEKWDTDGPHDLLLEHINAAPFMELVREITGIKELVKADAQATLYAPNHFLGVHDDSHVMEGWRVAYVLNLSIEEWKPEWGGYLLFHDEDDDIVAGYKPRFNSLNLFRVPLKHSVTFVPPFAPIGRLALTGWFRDR